MEYIQLFRITEKYKEFTKGNFLHNGDPFAVSLERPDRNNNTNISCIPEGIYDVKPWESKSHPGTYKIEDVSGRTDILIHIGNILDNSAGCILIGESFDLVLGEFGIKSSKHALGELNRIVNRKPFVLEIKRVV